jgi:hypothetical protein
VSDPRVCAHEGCSTVLAGARPEAVYCSAACRTAAWRARSGYRIPTLSEQRKPSQNGRAKPSGLQVSYRKAVDQVADMLERSFIEKPCNARRLAEGAVKAALSERQRAILAEREPTYWQERRAA